MRGLHDTSFLLAGAVVVAALLFGYSNLKGNFAEGYDRCQFISTQLQ